MTTLFLPPITIFFFQKDVIKFFHIFYHLCHMNKSKIVMLQAEIRQQFEIDKLFQSVDFITTITFK
jgi:hypothetical protein